ncbi:hypothetical protein [Helicobacter pylori]|uniref:hypothetical protein n=1 Tax=Helicobacter pylori TaxID=210 RepID=UPI00165C87FA|nr:hypothetical protein [Helicobacter pylori]
MWHESFIKVIPAVVFLFCLLEILELVLIINDMNKTEKLEAEIKNDLKVLQDDLILLNKYLGHKKINIKQCNSI